MSPISENWFKMSKLKNVLILENGYQLKSFNSYIYCQLHTNVSVPPDLKELLHSRNKTIIIYILYQGCFFFIMKENLNDYVGCIGQLSPTFNRKKLLVSKEPWRIMKQPVEDNSQLLFTLSWARMHGWWFLKWNRKDTTELDCVTFEDMRCKTFIFYSSPIHITCFFSVCDNFLHSHMYFVFCMIYIYMYI